MLDAQSLAALDEFPTDGLRLAPLVLLRRTIRRGDEGAAGEVTAWIAHQRALRSCWERMLSAAGEPRAARRMVLQGRVLDRWVDAQAARAELGTR